jgi:hypothetical protein
MNDDEINDPKMLEAATAAGRSQTNIAGERLIDFSLQISY